MSATVPNKQDSMLKHNTQYTEPAKRGKHPIVATNVTTKDVHSSTVVGDFEARITADKATKTVYRPKKEHIPGR